MTASDRRSHSSTESSRARVEVGVPSAAGERTLAGGLVVYGRAAGAETAYDPIHELYDAIARYIDENRFEQRGPTREVYLGRRHFADEIEVVPPVERPDQRKGPLSRP